MKHLTIITILLLCFSGCEKNELTTLEDLRTEAVTWELDAYIYSPGGSLVTSLLDSDRTLQFWEGSVRTNGSLCILDAAAGSIQETSYDPINQTIGPVTCMTDTTSYAQTWPYSINETADYLIVQHPACVEGCAYRYRRSSQ